MLRGRISVSHLSALTFMVPYAALAGGAGAALTEEVPSSHLTSSLSINVLLPLKAGVIGVLAAALLTFWGFFWTEVIAAQAPEDLPDTVRSYRRSFGYFLPALLLLFTSMAADFYLYLVSPRDRGVTAISFGTFGAALFMLLVFMLDFGVRTLVEMDALKGAGDYSQRKRSGIVSGAAGGGSEASVQAGSSSVQADAPAPRPSPGNH